MDQIFNIGRSIFESYSQSKKPAASSGGVGVGDAIRVIREVDRNNDGKITEEDFVDLVRDYELGPLGEECARGAFKQVYIF